jgi:hypothetical protein
MRGDALKRAYLKPNFMKATTTLQAVTAATSASAVG